MEFTHFNFIFKRLFAKNQSLSIVIRNAWFGIIARVSGSIISIPDGRELTERDYFREDALEDVAALVGRRMVEKYGEPQFGEKNPSIRKGANCCMTVSRDGMTWWVEPYALYSGATGVTNATIPWSDLKPFSK